MPRGVCGFRFGVGWVCQRSREIRQRSQGLCRRGRRRPSKIPLWSSANPIEQGPGKDAAHRRTILDRFRSGCWPARRSLPAGQPLLAGQARRSATSARRAVLLQPAKAGSLLAVGLLVCRRGSPLSDAFGRSSESGENGLERHRPPRCHVNVAAFHHGPKFLQAGHGGRNRRSRRRPDARSACPCLIVLRSAPDDGMDRLANQPTRAGILAASRSASSM